MLHRYEIHPSRWTGPGLRILHLSDFHWNAALPSSHFDQVRRAVRDARPDLIFLTGDYLKNLDSLPHFTEWIRSLGRRKIYAVLGNHDYWLDGNTLARELRATGAILLTNESRHISLGSHRVTITGCDHPWGGGDGDVAPSPEAELHLVLSHTPDNIYRLSRSRADCVFSGHYHAGQIRLPLAGSLVVPSRYGRRFDHGHFKVGDTRLFVSAGVGAANPALRLFCPADLFVVDINPRGGSRPAPAARRACPGTLR
jgi:predicted MPP superfamily phosphohydrolase